MSDVENVTYSMIKSSDKNVLKKIMYILKIQGNSKHSISAANKG